MQNIFRTSLILLTAVLYLSSCKKDGIDTYQAGRYIQFDQSYQDTIALSFFLYPNENEFQVPLPVELIGKITAQDLAYTIKADSATTATSSVYSLPASFSLGQGKPIDTAWIKVIKQPELQGKEVLLVLDITGSSDLKPGKTDNIRRVIRISDKISKPTWWDATMEAYYLGKYSDKKFSTFIQVVGTGDLSIYSAEQQRGLMLEFKYYLIKMRDAGTPVLEDDGTDMLSSIPLIG